MGCSSFYYSQGFELIKQWIFYGLPSFVRLNGAILKLCHGLDLLENEDILPIQPPTHEWHKKYFLEVGHSSLSRSEKNNIMGFS